MKPVGVDKKGERFVIIHKCIKCGKVMRNKVQEADDFEEVLSVLRS
jgi:hypothetical protein